jgi:hypothetical protein
MMIVLDRNAQIECEEDEMDNKHDQEARLKCSAIFVTVYCDNQAPLISTVFVRGWRADIEKRGHGYELFFAGVAEMLEILRGSKLPQTALPERHHQLDTVLESKLPSNIAHTMCRSRAGSGSCESPRGKLP